MTDADKIKELTAKVDLYEHDGAAKLFFALNRKANEMANLLNKTDLSTLSLDDKNDKTFERLKIIWNDAASISTAIKTLGESAGVTADDETKTKKVNTNLTPESISDVLKNSAGSNN